MPVPSEGGGCGFQRSFREDSNYLSLLINPQGSLVDSLRQYFNVSSFECSCSECTSTTASDVLELTLEQSLDYDVMKSAVLRAYELVPEAYWQKFRKHVKTSSQTFGEFAREKTILFEKWCAANKISTFEQLKELILVEEFKNCVTEKIVVHLNEQKVTSLTEAAIFADEFVLTHKVVFSPLRSSRRVMERSHNPKTVIVQNDEQGPDSRECFYCREKGHLIAACPVLQRKNQRKAHKSVAFVRTHSSESMLSTDPTFEPFVCDGTVSFSEFDTEHKHVRILRDTGAAQSFILADVLPFSTQSSCGQFRCPSSRN